MARSGQSRCQPQPRAKNIGAREIGIWRNDLRCIRRHKPTGLDSALNLDRNVLTLALILTYMQTKI
eukprot:84744-Pleurochrysis_carterae.AAC.1